MAGGTDQSVNLSGMLNQIAGVIGSGYTIAGKNAGEAMGDQIANAFRPEVKHDDPKSLEEYAEWARRNNKPEEANRAADKAALLRREQGEAKAIAEAAEISTRGLEMVANGDEQGFNGLFSQITQQQQAAGDAGNATRARELARTSQMLQQQRPALIENRVNNQANNVLMINEALSNGYTTDNQGNKKELDPETRRRMEITRAAALEDHKVVAKTNQIALQQHQVNVAQREQERFEIEKQVMPKVANASTQEELEDAIAQVPPEIYKDMLPVINEQEARLERRKKSEEEAIDLRKSVFGEADIAALEERISQLPEAEQKVWRREIKRLQDANEKAMPGGLYTREGKTLMKGMYNKLDNNLFNRYVADSTDRVRRERNEQESNRAELLRMELDLASPLDPDQVRRWAEANGTTPAEAERGLLAAKEEAFKKQMALVDPERAAAEQAEVDARVNAPMPEAVVNDAQESLVKKVRGKASAADMSDEQIIQFLKDEKLWPADNAGQPREKYVGAIPGSEGVMPLVRPLKQIWHEIITPVPQLEAERAAQQPPQ